MFQINADEAKSRLPDLIEAALRGETIYIAEDDQHVVQLVPVVPPTKQPTGRPTFGSARGTVVMSDDFDWPISMSMCDEVIARYACLPVVH